MCFSNLPIEFDDDGDPYLAAEADEVGKTRSTGSGRGTVGAEQALDEADSEELYAEILETIQDSDRDGPADGAGTDGHVTRHEPLEGD